MRAALLAVAVIAGLVVGATAMLAASAPETTPRQTPPTSHTDPSEPEVKVVPVPEPAGEVLLVWAAGGLPAGLADDVAALSRVIATTVVRGDVVELSGSVDGNGQAVDELPDGFVIPLDAVAVDTASMAAFLPKSAGPQLTGLADGEVVLSATSAQLRGLDTGGRLDVGDGDRLEVAGVVDDALIGAAELAMTTATGGTVGVTTERYLLVQHRGERAAVEQEIREIAADVTLRIRGPGETPVFRHGDAVLPQAAVKEQFGEFSYRPTTGRDVQQDPGWVTEHIVTADVPILGEVRCHRAIIPALEGALAELADANLAWLVDAGDYSGCHAARRTRSGQSVSRHAWGIAFDLNFSKNPVGRESTQDPRLVNVMERWGFTWGGQWLVPDPAHFEYVRPAPHDSSP